MRVSAQITINGTKAAVWAAITNFRNAAEMISGIEKMDILEEPVNTLVGLKWRETRQYFGKPSVIDKWITAAVEKESYQTRAEMDGFLFITTMHIMEDSSGIILSSTHETKPQGFVARLKSLPMIFFSGMIKKALLKDLKDVKAFVEKN